MTGFSPKKRTYLASRFKRNLEAAGLDFLRRQNMLSSEATLDADIVVKALNGSLDAAAQSVRGDKSTSRKKTSGAGVQEVEKEIRFDPNGVRDPGQVLKLHVTGRDLEKPGDNFGWVDPPKQMAPEERRQNNSEALQWLMNKPKIRLRTYEQDPRTGKPILDTEKEIEAKSLGRTIKDRIPGGNLAARAARALGLIIDDLGKFRCPPGTPAANQFTDAFGTNCFKPIGGMRSSVQGLMGHFQYHNQRGAEMKRQQDKLKATLAERRAAAANAEKMIGGTETSARAMKRINKAIKKLKDQYGIPDGGYDTVHADNEGRDMNEDLWALLEAITDETGDFPDIDWKPMFTNMAGDQLWDDGKTFKENMSAMREALLQDAFMFMSYDSPTNAAIVHQNYDRGDETVVAIVNELVQRHKSVMRGFLTSQLYKMESDPNSMATLKAFRFRDYNPSLEEGSHESYWSTDAETVPLYNGDGTGMGVEIVFNPTAMAMREFTDVNDATKNVDSEGRPLLLLVDHSLEGSHTEAEEWADINAFLQNSARLDVFKELFGANISAAAHGGTLEAFAMHTGFHEFNHVKQYTQMAQAILEAYDRDGYYEIPNPNRGEKKLDGTFDVGLWKKLEGKPATWSNGDWAMAVSAVFDDKIPPGVRVDFPPVSVETFEGGMLHLLAGEYYQRLVKKYLAMSGGVFHDIDPAARDSEEKRMIHLMLMEGTAELAALRDMGIIEGSDLDELLDWLDRDVDEARLGIAETDLPHRPRRVDELADMGEPPWETADDLPPGYVVTPSGQIVPTGSTRRKAGGNIDAIRDAIERAGASGMRSEIAIILPRPGEPMPTDFPEERFPSDSIIWDPDDLRPGGRFPGGRFPGPDGSGRPKPMPEHVFDPDVLRELVDKRPPRTDADAWEAWTSSVRETPFGTSFLNAMLGGGGGGGGNREKRISDLDKELRKNRAQQDRLQRMTEERRRRDREPELKPEFLPYDPYGPIRDDDDRLPRRPGRPAWEYPESDPRWRPQPLMMDDFWDVEPIRPIPLRMAEITEEHQQLKTARSAMIKERKQLIRERNPLSREGMRAIKMSRTSDDPDVAKKMESRNSDIFERAQETAFNAPDGWGDKYTPDRQYTHMPPIQNRRRSLEDHHQKLEESLTDLEELSRVGQIWGPNSDVIEIDLQVSEFMSTRTREEVGETIAKAAMTWHRGFDRRPRVALDIEEFDNLVTNGTHSRPDIPEGDNSAVAMRKYYDLRNGFDINTPTSDRPISGHLYHATHDDVVNDLITSLDGPNMERLPDFFDPQGPAPWGDSAQMGGDIDLVLRPEASNRTHYGFGDAMTGGAIPVPMNSNNADEILAANTPRWNQGTEDGPFSNTKKMHDLLKAGITSNYRDLNPDGKHHEAQILGGVELDDVEFVRYPVNKLNWKTRQLTDRDIGSKDKSTRRALRNAGFSESEIDYFYAAILDGRVTGLRNVNWLRQNLAAREANKRFERIGLDVKFTNPDGIDLMNVDTFLTTGVSSTNAADAIRQRITMEIVNNAKELLVDLRREIKPNRNNPVGVLV